MHKKLHGKVHGRTIELDEDPGLVDGQDVEVEVKVVPPEQPWGEGIRRTAGALADDPDWDAIMEEIYQARKVERRPQFEAEGLARVYEILGRRHSSGHNDTAARDNEHQPNLKGGSAMTKTFHAIYENGVFRPTEAVDLPENCEVEMEVREIKSEPQQPTLDDVYAILGRRHASGEHDLAERHNEHQP